MNITDEMVERAACAAWCADGDSPESWRNTTDTIRARWMREARAALQAVAESIREERLTRYRCAALTGAMNSPEAWRERWRGNGIPETDESFATWFGLEIEAAAQVTLAAERPAVALDKETL